MQKLTALPDPITFEKELFSFSSKFNFGFYVHNMIICGITDISIVTIKNCKLVTIEHDDVPWFRLECYAGNGAVFIIVTDLRVAYPVTKANRIGQKRQIKSSINLDDMTAQDLEFIKWVVDRWLVEGK